MSHLAVFALCEPTASASYRAVLKHEPEIDVHQVPLCIEQDIPVVAVFDVQQVAHDGVRGLP